MQEETQKPGYHTAQEPNNPPDPGAATPRGLDPEVNLDLMIDRAEPFAPEGPSAASWRTYSHG